MKIRNKSGGEQRRRFSKPLWLACLAAIAVLALGISGTLAAFTATITNDQNHVQTAGAETFGLSEALVSGGAPVSPECAVATAGQTATCSTINKYGTNGQAAGESPLLPSGTPNVTTVNLKNTASASTPAGLSGDLTLTVGACSDAPLVPPGNPGYSAGILCAVADVELTCSNGFTVGPESMDAFASGGPTYTVETGLDPEASVNCTFTTSLPDTATSTALQNVETSQELTWVLTSV